MISALCYLQTRTAVNRLRARLKRLKQPKYLIGALIGGAYFWFYIFRFWMMPSRPRPGMELAGPQAFQMPVELLEGVGALVLFVLVLLAWLVPHERAALIFSEAEIAFLFPAPISRRGLLHYKLARSQVAILFTTLLLTLLSGRWRAGPVQAMIGVLGWWFVLATLNLHFLGSSLTRTLLLDRGVSNWLRRGLVLLVAGGLVTAIVVWARRSLPTLDLGEVNDFASLTEYLNQLLAAGPAPYLLLPFRIALRPFLATGLGEFLLAVGPALLLLGLHYVWVVRTNVAFEEASVAASEKVAATIAAVRAGKGASLKPMKKKRAPFQLGPTGFAPVALLWKNLISAGQLFSTRAWLIVLWLVIVLGVTLSTIGRGEHQAWPAVLGGVLLGLLAMSFLIGPAVTRVDLRQDLTVADLLKAYPLRGWQVVLGEMLAPMAILTAVQGLLVVAAVILFSPKAEVLPLTTRAACGLAVMIVAPALNFASLLIPNAAAVLFPGWMPRGKERPQGIEATGQAMIMLFGQFFVLLIALAPAAALGVGLFFVGKLLFPWPAVVPLAAVATALVLAAESALGVWLIGKAFERMDVSEELGQ
jgi:ABC-2 type transport system permease protein